jgi:hypothetical protein
MSLYPSSCGVKNFQLSFSREHGASALALHTSREKEFKRLGRGFVEICAAGYVRQLVRPCLVPSMSLEDQQATASTNPASARDAT